MTSLKIQTLLFNDKSSLDLKDDDIVIFTGPNNAGKSQSLTDIFSNFHTPGSGKVVTSTVTESLDRESLEPWLNDFAKHQDDRTYHGAGFHITGYQIDKFCKEGIVNDQIALFLSSNLNTAQRLNITQPQEKIGDRDPMRHPVHYVSRNRGQMLKEIEKAFHEAFGLHLQLNDYDGKYHTFVVSGDEIKIEGDLTEMRVDEAAEFLKRKFDVCPRLHDQGDGMKSFTGILLNLLVPHYSTYIIDEPESFLHPPQAYVMGKVLGEISAGKQLFLATHSDQLLKGLIDTVPERLKIVRLVRDGDINRMTVLDGKGISELWSDPLLRYSDIMNVLFYSAAVVTESNADCKLYRILYEERMRATGNRKDTIFVECGGKQRMKIVCGALRSLNIEFRAVPDFDILRKDTQAKDLYESCGGDWDRDCADDWNIVNGSLPELPDEINKTEVERKFKEALDNIDSEQISIKRDIPNLRKAISGHNKWDIPKKMGLAGIPEGAPRQAAERIMTKFNSVGIYPVRTGEMESLVPEIKDHGKDWVGKLLAAYPDINGPVYATARAFIASWNL